MVAAAPGIVNARPDWKWADIDGERLVGAAAGVLHAGRTTPDGLADARPLLDFNPMTFTPVVAPY